MSYAVPRPAAPIPLYEPPSGSLHEPIPIGGEVELVSRSDVVYERNHPRYSMFTKPGATLIMGTLKEIHPTNPPSYTVLSDGTEMTFEMQKYYFVMKPKQTGGLRSRSRKTKRSRRSRRVKH